MPEYLGFLAGLVKDSKLFKLQELFFPFFFSKYTKVISIELEKMNLKRSKIDLKKIIGLYGLVFKKDINNTFLFSLKKNY